MSTGRLYSLTGRERVHQSKAACSYCAPVLWMGSDHQRPFQMRARWHRGCTALHEAEKSGCIILASLVSGQKAGPRFAIYAPAKHVVRTLSKGLRQEANPCNTPCGPPALPRLPLQRACAAQPSCLTRSIVRQALEPPLMSVPWQPVSKARGCYRPLPAQTLSPDPERSPSLRFPPARDPRSAPPLAPRSSWDSVVQ